MDFVLGLAAYLLFGLFAAVVSGAIAMKRIGEAKAEAFIRSSWPLYVFAWPAAIPAMVVIWLLFRGKA